jgi:predicted TIM-barrel fold metal-dependent hydrolase
MRFFFQPLVRATRSPFDAMKTPLVVAILALPITAARAQSPVGDYHQHLFSPAAVAMLNQPRGISATELIVLLDSAGIRNALVLSVAYMYGAPIRTVDDEYAKVRAENDWTAAQVRLYPDRLKAACSVNPLKDYAVQEIVRCGKDPVLKRALKLHFGNSDVRTEIPEQLEQLKRVFRAANENRMTIVVHMRANTNGRPYGVEQGKIFLEQLLPLTPDIAVQIAHLAGSGGAALLAADSVLAICADAIAKKDPRVKNVWFDVTSVADSRLTPDQGERVAARIRQLGLTRVIYGSDAAATPAAAPKNGWAYFRKLPLTDAEVATIAANVPPYMR